MCRRSQCRRRRLPSWSGEQSSYHCTGVSAGDDFVKVPKMKKIKAVMHRKIEGKVKSITLSMDICYKSDGEQSL